MLNEQGCIGPGQLDREGGRLFLRIEGGGRAFRGADAVLQAHTAQLVQGGEECGDLLGSFLQVVDGHNKTVSQNEAADGRDLAGKLQLPASAAISAAGGRAGLPKRRSGRRSVQWRRNFPHLRRQVLGADGVGNGFIHDAVDLGHGGGVQLPADRARDGVELIGTARSP